MIDDCFYMHSTDLSSYHNPRYKRSIDMASCTTVVVLWSVAKIYCDQHWNQTKIYSKLIVKRRFSKYITVLAIKLKFTISISDTFDVYKYIIRLRQAGVLC